MAAQPAWWLVFEPSAPAAEPPIWQVGALCRAVADALDRSFNPVAVCGEVSGFSRAASGHCYFSIKDAQGQLRCAMFRRAAGLLDFAPRDGERVEARGRLSVYEARGELQLVVESLRRAGAGALFEQFLRLKARLEAEGLFDPARKRPLPALPRAIGIVTSRGAAALHDVLSVLRRRVPHLPVLVSPARVQGTGAGTELAEALARLHQSAPRLGVAVDLVLLVRGGGSIEDLWAFNEEVLARAIVACPVPVIAGVGHETDFTIADFCADLRAPTPTAAAELAAESREQALAALQRAQARLQTALQRELDGRAQRLDRAAQRLGRPSALVHAQALLLLRQRQRLQTAVRNQAEHERARLLGLNQRLRDARQQVTRQLRERLARAEQGLALLDPGAVLRRGYAWLAEAEQGRAITSVAQLAPGQPVRATLADGSADLTVAERRQSPTSLE